MLVQLLRHRQRLTLAPEVDARQRVVTEGVFVVPLRLLVVPQLRLPLIFTAAEQTKEPCPGATLEVLRGFMFGLDLVDRVGGVQQATAHLFRGEGGEPGPLQARIV
ncbi:hypothetical protein D3C80_1984690 [compost metagenome]